jgi:hypothetical protein
MVVERHQYVVVAKVPSGARFLPEHQFAINEVPTTEGPVRLVIRTRWDDIGLEHAVPRELWFDVRGEATSLDAAVAAFSEAARAFGPFVAFVANVEVGLVEVHLAYDATPQLDEHEFMEVFLPDQRGLPTEGRRIDPELLHAFVAALAPHNEWKRLTRALGHYELALRSWFLGGEPLALAHLFIAAENLTKSALRAECRSRSLSEDDLARAVGIDPDDPSRPRWRPALYEWARSTLVFKDDAEVHRLAREASDGLEHGFMEVSDVHARARAVTARTFELVREAILDLLPLSDDARERLRGVPPRDVRSLRKIMRGAFIGTGDLAATDQEYPLLRWTSSASRFVREGDDLDVSFTERVQVVAAEGVEYRLRGFEARGRAEPGQRPIELSPTDVNVTVNPPPTGDAVVSATRDALDFMEHVASSVDATLPVSTGQIAVPIEVTPVNALALQKLWRTRSLFLASVALIRAGWCEEAILLGRSLWDESIFLAQFADAREERPAFYLRWRQESLQRALAMFREVHATDQDFDIAEVEDALEHQLGPGLAEAQVTFGVSALPDFKTGKQAAEAAGRAEDYHSYLMASSIAEGAFDSVMYRQRDIDDSEHGRVLGMHDRTMDPAVVTAAARFLVDSYIACHTSVAMTLGWQPLDNPEELRARGKALAERDYSSGGD